MSFFSVGPEYIGEGECPDCHGCGYDFGDGGQCDRCGGTGEIDLFDDD